MPDTGTMSGSPPKNELVPLKMASQTRVLHVGKNLWMKRSQAYRGIENCAWAWVEVGVSVRDLSLHEAMTARNEQARLREPLEWAEIPGLVFEGPLPVRNDLIRAAHEFATSR